jgi:hypothetical protein
LNVARDGWRKRRLSLCGTVLRIWTSGSSKKKRLGSMPLLSKKHPS